MTQVLVEDFRWVSSALVLDWYTNKIFGSGAGTLVTARQCLTALAKGSVYHER
jgi:hypothetical protein